MLVKIRLFALMLVVVGFVACNAKSGGLVKGGSTTAAESSEDKRDAPGADDAVRREAEKGKKIEGAAGAADYDGSDIAATKEAVRNGKGYGGESDHDAPRPAARERDWSASKSSQSGLKAGFADDNHQYGYFLKFLSDYASVNHLKLDVSERIALVVKDSLKKPVANAMVSVYSGAKRVAYGKTYADGTCFFFPSDGASGSVFTVRVEYNQQKIERKLDRGGARQIEMQLNAPRVAAKNVPLDMLFIMDTTGSMGEEIARLKQTIEIINANLASLSSKPKIRFGMVLYRDRGDEYVTKIIPFTSDLDAFQDELDKVSAGGGGDTPEDLQTALDDAVRKMKWNEDGIRLAYVITDAAPHLDYGQQYTYVDAARDAARAGIKIFTVGTGGLDISGEIVLRQISQYTYGRYIFLTYGERGESEGGKEGSVSHHTGANFTTDKLETIIMRFAKEELAWLTDAEVDRDDEFIEARKIDDEKNEETLKKLFAMSVGQLIDYATIKIDKGTPAAIVPFSVAEKVSAAEAEYFSEQASLALSANGTFTMVERKDMQKILKELALADTGLVDEASAAKMGKMLGAKIIISGRLYEKKGQYEIFIKMFRVETGEVLSVNKLRIDRKLGLGK